MGILIPLGTQVLSATGATVKDLTIEANGNGYAIYTNGNTTVEGCTFDHRLAAHLCAG